MEREKISVIKDANELKASNAEETPFDNI